MWSSPIRASALALALGWTSLSASAEVQAQPVVAAAMGDSPRIPVGDSPALGRADALVTLVVFSDFQCPFCARLLPTLAAARARYGDDLRVVFKHNPLPFHRFARPAAEAAQAVYAIAGADAFWRLHDALFEVSARLDDDAIDAAVERAGVDPQRVRAALASHTYAPVVDADMRLAASLEARGTPSMFINGTRVVGAVPIEMLTGVIDPVLARARRMQPRGGVYAAMVADPEPSPSPPSRPAGPRQVADPAQVLRVPAEGAPSMGPASAAVTMVMFGDLQCPFTARAWATVESLRRRYGDRLRVVWRHNPLAFHDRAREAAEAAAEVRAQGGDDAFWRFVGAALANRSALSRDDLERYALDAGVDVGRLRASLDQRPHAEVVGADMRLAARLEATGTPSFFINGARLSGSQPEAAFVTAIDAAEARAQAYTRAHPGVSDEGRYDAMMALADADVRRVNAPTPARDDPDRVFTLHPARRAPSFGPARAPVVIEHFTDFECPFCARVAPTLAALQRRYRGRVRWVWRNYPLSFHPHAALAAEAAHEAFVQRGAQGFARYRDLLFANRVALEREDLERYAAQTGLNLTRFRAALDGRVHEAAVREDVAAVAAAGARIGTPAFFINGRYFAGARPLAEFVQRIDEALRRRRPARR